jgi:hypothetical protein
MPIRLGTQVDHVALQPKNTAKKKTKPDTQGIAALRGRLMLRPRNEKGAP